MTHNHEIHQSMETNPEEIEIIELVDNDLTTAIINMLNDVKQCKTNHNEAQREKE